MSFANEARRSAPLLALLLLFTGCRSDWEPDRAAPATIDAGATPYDFGPFWPTPLPRYPR